MVRAFIILLAGLFVVSCSNKKKEEIDLSQVNSKIMELEQKAKEFEEPANDAIKILLASMGDSLEFFKTKDFNELKKLAIDAENKCHTTAEVFKEYGQTIPESFPDSIQYSLVAVAGFLHDAYLGRAKAMNSAVKLFTDSTGIHLEDMSKNLYLATEFSDKAIFGLQALKKNVQKIQ